MSLEQVQQQAVATYNTNIAYFKEHHPDLYNNLVVFETALNGNHIKAQYDLQYKENYFEIIGLEQNIPFYGQNSITLSQAMVDKNLTMDATKNSFKAYYEHQYNDEIAQIALESDMLVKYTISIAPLVHYVNKNLPNPQMIKDIHKYIIFGVGLGLHIPYIHQKINAKMYLIVESNLEIFRLSLFVTNYAQLSKEAKLLFAVAQEEVAFRETFNKLYAEAFVLNHYFKFFQFSGNNDLYFKTIQNFLVSQPHYLYSYDRTFLSLLRTHSYISQGYKTLNISTIHQLKLFEKPVLYLAAGPSLQRNIEFVKENQDKFTIIAIYATLPLLEKHDIKPNIVTQYDEQDIQVLNTLDRIKDITYFKDTIFIFSSHVNAKLMSSFPKNNIFIFQAMFELKKDFGMLTSPSIGELTYGLLLKLGAKNIYILGLDLAMDVETNQTHIDGHSGSNVFKNLKELDESLDTEYSYRKNTIKVKGNFIDEVKSIPVFKTNIDSFGVLTKQFKSDDCDVYNLSNGAYLEGAEPKQIQDIQINSFENNSFNTLQEQLDSTLQTISEENYNKNDIESINLKISGAKKIKKSLDQFFKIKNHKNLEVYKDKLIGMLSDILFSKYNCEDLQQILINYTSHVSHHVFHLFSLEGISEFKKHIYEINKVLSIQLHKIVNTYVISISYSKDENNITKKLNKFIKEYNIKDTSYSEAQFKELVETSLKGEQLEHGKNSIGFFAIEENLDNKDFIEYVQNIIKLLPNLSLKLFYFYEYQKTLAQHIFKQYLKNIELIIPHNIQEIATQVELWLETSEKTLSLKKCDDILLNNYTNIYSAMFTKEAYNKELTTISHDTIQQSNSIKESLEQNYILPTTPYYSFANSLKEPIDDEKLNKTYKKEQIGFFAFEENLTKEFVQSIVDIYNAFPQLKFVAFYFDAKQKEKFELQFKNLISRFTFIIPDNIDDILNNIEVWLEAEIKYKSFLFKRICSILDKTLHVYPIIINEEFELTEGETFLHATIKNFNVIRIKHSLNVSHGFDLYKENSIGFSAIDVNFENKEFVNYIHQLHNQFPTLEFKIFYVNEVDKVKAQTIFNLDQQVEFILPTSIQEVMSEIQFYVHIDFAQEIISPFLVKSTNILDFRYDFNQYSHPVREYDKTIDKNNYMFTDYAYFGLSDNDFENANGSYIRLMHTFFFQHSDMPQIEIQDSDNYYDIVYFKIFEWSQKYKKHIHARKKLYHLMVNYNKSLSNE